MLYALLLVLHSLLRWLVLASVAMVCARAALGRRQGRVFGARDATWIRVWVGATDVQLAVGLTLYFAASPVAAMARADLSGALRDPTLRFFGWLHPVLMVLAFVLTHATWGWVRRTTRADRRFERSFRGAFLTMLVLVCAVPWPFWSFGRPLLRP